MYNDLKKGDDDNPTIGIILCTEKDETVVKYSVMSENKNCSQANTGHTFSMRKN